MEPNIVGRPPTEMRLRPSVENLTDVICPEWTVRVPAELARDLVESLIDEPEAAAMTRHRD